MPQSYDEERESLEGTQLIRVLLADDQALFRRGIRAVLTHELDFEVVAEAESGTEAVRLATEQVPDVVLMDVRMPHMGGIEATRAIKQACPTTRIVMLTMSDEEDDLYEAIKSGATGYLLKEVSVATVADALRMVVQGESFLSPTMASKLLGEFATLSSNAALAGSSSPLTEREIDVLRRVASGADNSEIADQLEVAESTVKNHVRNILEKLHIHDRLVSAANSTASPS